MFQAREFTLPREEITMIHVTPFERLGAFKNGWLDAHHHFSFSSYYDPERMGFGPLRVWNDDRIEAGTGFDMHGHRDMEIITYVRRGAITHTDHLKNVGRTEAGDVQVMSAGRGIMHAEHNQESEATELFQIWIEPARRGITPAWAARSFPKDERAGRLLPLASGRLTEDGVLPIHQDATLFGASMAAGKGLEVDIEPGRIVYLVPSAGSILVNGIAVPNRAGVAITDETRLTISGPDAYDLVLADLPGGR
jgi:redox-sensitive bicupin YhaK (pirin superfamily)